MTQFISGLAEIIDQHDAFIVDQWGVLHEGVQAYPGAKEVMERILASGKEVVVLSNSGKKAEANARRLAEMGFSPERYAGIVTSGEAVWQSLATDTLPTGTGKRHYVVSQEASTTAEWCAGLDAGLFVASLEQAEVVVLLALPYETTAATQEGMLAAMRERDLPLVCGNPDVRAPGPACLHNSPGGLAAQYERMDGIVHYFGKPHPGVFTRSLEQLRFPAPARVLMVGDNLATDVVGAERMGMASLLLRQGVHSAAFGEEGPTLPGQLACLLEDTGMPAPTYCSLRM